MHEGSDPRLFWIALNNVPGVGRATFRKLVKRFGSPEQALRAPAAELAEMDGLPAKVAAAIASFDGYREAEQELARAREAGVAIITADDAAYPENLRAVPDAPLYVYLLGSMLPADRDAVAIVGTRRPTFYGKYTARKIAADLAAAGITIVSGMARGIDTEAHRGALAAGGRSIAVLGCGIDTAYPPENRGLMQELVRSGAVVTEYAFGTKPEAGYFPARNRIISGLSCGTVIVEATGDSGSLITAQYSLEQQRYVFAVPGNIVSAASRGANSLIKKGALLVESAADILAGLGRGSAGQRQRAARPLPELTASEHDVLRRLTDEPKHIDLLLNESSLAPGALGGVLMNLELKGLAKQLPGKYFVREIG
ncbi:MAG TPA: DNA-processing protein DprA [Nitrospirota bacterium]|nr:DNA-processing protein DprA [Nitrospirota bacterium]